MNRKCETRYVCQVRSARTAIRCRQHVRSNVNMIGGCRRFRHPGHSDETQRSIDVVAVNTTIAT